MQGAHRLGYPSLDSDSEDSVKHLTRVLGTSHVFMVFKMCTDTIFGLMIAQVTAATTTLPFQGITAAVLSHFSLVWQGIRSRHAAQSRKKCGRYTECRFLRTCVEICQADGVCMLIFAGGSPARRLSLTIMERQSRYCVCH
jgi:hypothetical protein